MKLVHWDQRIQESGNWTMAVAVYIARNAKYENSYNIVFGVERQVLFEEILSEQFSTLTVTPKYS